jgi:hypothetical protein
MTIDDEPLEPLAIDDGSPGERMIGGGRAGMGRLGEIVDDQPFAVAALLWMVCTLISVGVGIYSVLDIFPGGLAFPGRDAWTDIALLAQTGGPVVAIACVVGIALAALSDTSTARFSLWLAAVGGAWVFVAGALGIAAALHGSDTGTITFIFSGRGNRAVAVVGGLAYAGLGLVVALVALRLARRRQAAPDLS